jgi:hypothetical protein
VYRLASVHAWNRVNEHRPTRYLSVDVDTTMTGRTRPKEIA